MASKVRGLYFEEFNVNDEFHSGFRTVAEEDIDGFAELTGDKNRIHTDPVFASSSIYGERIAHGLLSLSLVSGLAVNTGFARDTAVALRSIEWKFSQAVKIGDTIQASYSVIQKKELAGQQYGLVKFKVIVENQNAERIQSGNWLLLIQKKPSG